MSGFRKLPDATTLRLLRNQGWRLIDIADKYGVTETGVWRALERANMAGGKGTYRDILPWIVATEHQSTAVARRFRTLLHQRTGRDIPAADLKALEDWLEMLKENNLVVNYHPEAPPNDASSKGGFYYVPREPQDEWIIRMPVLKVTDTTVDPSSDG